MGYLKCVLSFLYLLLSLKPSITSKLARGGNSDTWLVDNIRVKRQEGYNYDRPSVSFDLPSRQSTIATQAPPATSTGAAAAGADRIQSQFMYYAYPVPSSGAGGGSYSEGGGGTVNIGFSSSSTTTASSVPAATVAAPPSTAAASFEGPSPTPGNTGYNYGTATDGSQAGACASGSGYNCNGPSSTSGPTQGTVSTNAPKYLPPLAGGGATADAGVSVSVSSGLESTSPLPTQAGPTAPSAVDGSYLPPSPQPSPRPTPGPTLGLPSSTTPAGYLPPIAKPGSGSNTVSTPASTYLPPMF